MGRCQINIRNNRFQIKSKWLETTL
jgi:hypothetical protein